MNINNDLSERLDELQIKVMNSITSLNELNTLLLSIQKNYDKTDMIEMLWNRGFNKNRISKITGIPYSTVTDKVNKLIKDKKIERR